MSGMSDNTIPLAAHLADNPRMIGALFTLVLLLTQAGNAMAAGGYSVAGP